MVDMTKYAKGQFINVEYVKSSTIKGAVFLTAGEVYKNKWGNDAVKFKVRVGNDIVEWTPNSTTVNNLNDAWGTDSEKWLTKVVRLEIEEKNDKEVVVGYPAIIGVDTNAYP